MKNSLTLQRFRDANLIFHMKISSELISKESNDESEKNDQIIQNEVLELVNNIMKSPSDFYDYLFSLSVLLDSSPKKSSLIKDSNFFKFLLTQITSGEKEIQSMSLRILCTILIHSNIQEDEFLIQIISILESIINTEFINKYFVESLHCLSVLFENFTSKIKLFLQEPSPIFSAFQFLQNFIEYSSIESDDCLPKTINLKTKKFLNVEKYILSIMVHFCFNQDLSVLKNIDGIFNTLFIIIQDEESEDSILSLCFNVLSASLYRNYLTVRPKISDVIINQVLNMLSHYELYSTNLQINLMIFIAYILDDHQEDCKVLFQPIQDIILQILTSTKTSYERTLCCEIIRVIIKSFPPGGITMLNHPIITAILDLCKNGSFEESFDAAHVFVTYFQIGLRKPLLDAFPSILSTLSHIISCADEIQANILLDILLSSYSEYGDSVLDKQALPEDIEDLISSDNDEIRSKAEKLMKICSQ